MAFLIYASSSGMWDILVMYAQNGGFAQAKREALLDGKGLTREPCYFISVDVTQD